jgi:hypothetical protein
MPPPIAGSLSLYLLVGGLPRCVSVVSVCQAFFNHRDAEVAQSSTDKRSPETGLRLMRFGINNRFDLCLDLFDQAWPARFDI